MDQTGKQPAPDGSGYFGIARWQAWAPGVETPADWSTWLDGGYTAASDTQPEVSQLPALLRRRLDRQGRMALHTAGPCVADLDAVAIVFASRHGALNRTLEMLAALARSEPLSPTLFSLAVHNSIAGLYSIARDDHSAATALAAGSDTLNMGLLEGAGMIAAGVPQVLVCFADDTLYPPYAQSASPSSTPAPFAISLLLVAAHDSSARWRCRLTPTAEVPREAPEAALLRFLLENTAGAVIGVDQPWRLETGSSAD